MYKNLVIGHNQEELTLEDAIMSTKDLDEGFIFSVSDISLKYHEFEKFIEELSEKINTFKVFDYSRGKNNIYRKYYSDNIRFYVKGNSLDIYASAYCTTEEIANKIWNTYLTYDDDDSSTETYFTTFYMDSNGVTENTKMMKESELNYISDKYYPYLDTNTMFEQFFTGDENILVVVGAPGLGKSKLSSLMLKYAFKNSDKLPYDKLEENPGLDFQFISVAYVKSTEVLANDKFWRMVESSKYDFIVLDDLDYMLTKRDSEVMTSEDQMKNNFLNQLLSFTDGVKKHKAKFIITTNQSYDEIDSALLRKGRLFDILELRKLSQQEAFEVWVENDLDKDEFYSIFTTHEVLPAELGSEINKRLNTRITSATKSYLLEDGISKTKKAGRTKKIGL